jgi:putative isomerase
MLSGIYIKIQLMTREGFSVFIFKMFIFFFSCSNASGQISPSEYTGKERSNLNTKLVKGWNTWNTRSVLSHVLLPECFAINLAIKDRSGTVLEEALIGRAHYDTKEHVTPGPHAYDGSYTELEVEWHNIRIKVQSATVNNELHILVSPLKTIRGDSLLIMPRILWNRKADITIDKNIIITFNSSDKIKFYVNGGNHALSSNSIRTSLDHKTTISSGIAKSPALVEQIITNAKVKFEAERRKYNKSQEVYEAMQTVLAWTTIYDPNNNRVINPVSRTFSPDWVLFGWDTYFAAYMLSLDNKDLAYANAIAITKEITSRGFIPNNVQFGHKSEDRSEPQVGSIVVREIYKKYKEKWLLFEVYNELLSWNRWRAANRDIDGYLVHGTDPYDYGESKSRSATQSGKMKAAKWESGMDNSPMWDEAIFDSINHRMLLADVGLMSLFIADCHSLAEIAAILGKADDAKELTDRAAKYSAKLETLWNEEFGLYLNKNLVTGKPSYRLTPTLFYPLLAKVPDQQKASRMMKEHFYNPNEFWGEYIMPSVSRNDTAFKDNHYWRGRIWAPLNFLVYLGIRNYDLPEARKDMVEKSKNLLLKTWLTERHVCENYHAENGRGGEAETWSDAFYHWGALLGFMDIIDRAYTPLPEVNLLSKKNKLSEIFILNL